MIVRIRLSSSVGTLEMYCMFVAVSTEQGFKLATLLLCVWSQVGDSGFYTCVASGPSGEATWTAYLQVEGRVHYRFTTVRFTTASLLIRHC